MTLVMKQLLDRGKWCGWFRTQARLDKERIIKKWRHRWWRSRSRNLVFKRTLGRS